VVVAVYGFSALIGPASVPKKVGIFLPHRSIEWVLLRFAEWAEWGLILMAERCVDRADLGDAVSSSMKAGEWRSKAAWHSPLDSAKGHSHIRRASCGRGHRVWLDQMYGSPPTGVRWMRSRRR
jgi:hypothetical protein